MRGPTSAGSSPAPLKPHPTPGSIPAGACTTSCCPSPRPGDFTPVRPADYAEHEATPYADLLRYLAAMAGIDYAHLIAEHGLHAQAGAEPGQ